MTPIHFARFITHLAWWNSLAALCTLETNVRPAEK
jgi:hypothetical protein